MNFEEYLISKKIDSSLFSVKEHALFSTWKTEFEQMHPNSFTVQKLNLINPIRRKYPLKIETKVVEVKTAQDAPAAVNQLEITEPSVTTPLVPKPAIPKLAPRPVFKPKPKTD